MTRIFHWFFMDPMSGFDIRLVFTLPPRDSTLQYKRCVHFWNNYSCITFLISIISSIPSLGLGVVLEERFYRNGTNDYKKGIWYLEAGGKAEKYRWRAEGNNGLCSTLPPYTYHTNHWDLHINRLSGNL